MQREQSSFLPGGFGVCVCLKRINLMEKYFENGSSHLSIVFLIFQQLGRLVKNIKWHKEDEKTTWLFGVNMILVNLGKLRIKLVDSMASFDF